VLAEDSSSASANLLVIRRIEGASTGVFKIHPAEGPFFYVREAYLPVESLAAIAGIGTAGPLVPDPDDPEAEGRIVPEPAAEGIIFASRAWLAERTAMGYLARSEYCRRQLEVRLDRKGFSRDEAGMALDFLEAGQKLSDERYASAWLRSRVIHQSEGKRKLLAGLLSRGVRSCDAERALAGFFVDADERALCERAAAKLRRMGKSAEKIQTSLVRKGFSIKLAAEMAKKALAE
jgi:regulatory protein